MPQHEWVGKRVRPKDVRNQWRSRIIYVIEVRPSILDSNKQVLVLNISGYSRNIVQPIEDFELA